MSRALHVTVDAGSVSTARAIAEVARTGSLVCLTDRLFTELAGELGGVEPAVQHLLAVAEDVGRPIAVNLETSAGASRAMFLAPRSWTQERLRGWVAGRHEAIEAMFGRVEPVPEGE